MAERMDEYAREVMRAGRDLGISARGIVIGFATVFVESAWKMYANRADPESLQFPHEAISYDANSVGLFQQRAPWWGTVAQRMDPYESAKLFFSALQKLDYNNTANSPGFYAQAVQRSAFPDRYDKNMGKAQQLYDRLAGSVPQRQVVSRVQVQPPQYRELNYMTGGGRSRRSRRPTNFFLHTQEGDGTATNLAVYCNGSNNVSYHYTLRDGVLCAVVDTDYASWSVLDANDYSVNLCYAGSFAGWTREQWLKREQDIAISAWIAVQDAAKYGFSTEVIKPPYGKARPGISDHNYVSKVIGVGNHTDVGPSYPWDVFESYVRRYTGQGQSKPPVPAPQQGGAVGALSPSEQREVLDLLRILAQVRFPSRSPLRHLGEGAIDTAAGISMSTDANVHVMVVKALAEAGVPSQIALLEEVANADPAIYPDRQEDAKLARLLLDGLGRRLPPGVGDLPA